MKTSEKIGTTFPPFPFSPDISGLIFPGNTKVFSAMLFLSIWERSDVFFRLAASRLICSIDCAALWRHLSITLFSLRRPQCSFHSFLYYLNRLLARLRIVFSSFTYCGSETCQLIIFCFVYCKWDALSDNLELRARWILGRGSFFETRWESCSSWMVSSFWEWSVSVLSIAVVTVWYSLASSNSAEWSMVWMLLGAKML